LGESDITMSMTNAEFHPHSLLDMYPFLANSTGEMLKKEINTIYNARKERKENLMDNRNYSVEQWLSGMIGDRRFYPAQSVRKYMEELLDSKFMTLPEFGDCIATPGGYHITANEEDKIVTVEIYDSTDKLVFSEAWLLRK
jgi:hypothetical protein